MITDIHKNKYHELQILHDLPDSNPHPSAWPLMLLYILCSCHEELSVCHRETTTQCLPPGRFGPQNNHRIDGICTEMSI